MGKSIKIYLADGSVAGIRHGEITNWTGQAIACPRAKFGLLRDWSETRRPGIYFLFGVDEESGRELVYIGEAEVVLDRLTSHVTGKEFWTELVVFTSKDDHLTKGHVRYLEARLIELVSLAGRHELTNTAAPSLPSLPRGDRDAMEEFIENIRTLVGVLGHRPLDSLRARAADPATEPPSATTTIPLGETGTAPSSANHFFLKVGGLAATAARTDEGIVVLAGSDAVATVQMSMSMGHRALREKLIANNVLRVEEDRYRFSRDSLFNSPSQAAAVIVGYSINGREAWRTKDNETWAAIESAANRSNI